MKFKSLLVIICLLHMNILPLYKSSSAVHVANPNVESFKFLFMYKYPEVKNEKDHKLNIFTYKNVLLANEELVYFASANEEDESKDEKYDTTKYLLTIRYEYLDIPCLNKSFLCTYSQFVKEYKAIYPEIDFAIPKEVLEKFGNPSEASENCLVFFLSSISKMEDAAWMCHPDLSLVLDTQLKLSKIILDANMIDYDFVADYIQNTNTVVKGVMNLMKDKFIFTDMHKKEVLTANWRSVEPYANSLYLKEKLLWTGDNKDKPDGQRCLQILRTSEAANNNPDYFCAYFHRNDITRKIALLDYQGRFAAEMYTNKINIRLHFVQLKQSLIALTKLSQKSLSIDSKILFPIKMEVRKNYFAQRHKLVVGLRTGKIKKADLHDKLQETKAKIIDRVCGGAELCKKAIGFCADKEILPMKGVREKFAMDMQNPYNRLMPRTNIKIDLPKEGSFGKAVMKAINKMKGALNYFAEKLPESPSGGVPNATAIKKAFNTFDTLRERKEYKKLEELQASCKSDERNNSNDITRKISFLMFAGDNDVFFEYLGFVRDFQLTKTNGN